MVSSALLVITLAQVPLLGAEAEHFLRTAEVVGAKDIPRGVTHPRKVELTDGRRTLSASWKTVDILKPGVTRFADGAFEVNFSDSYEYEVAAYELDELLGLGLVPPTVERHILGETGALQLWVENAMTDFERRAKNVPIPNPLKWNRQVYNLQLFRQLTYDVDYKNTRNTLIDPDWKIWAIDSSRAFRLEAKLFEKHSIDHFSRRVLARLETLDFETLKKRLGRWISDERLRALLARRDLLLERAERLVMERGEGAVLVP